MKTISEKELEEIFAGKKKKKRPRRFYWYIYGSLTILLLAVIYIVINAPAVGTKVKYWYESDFSPVDDNASTSSVNSGNAGTQNDLADNTIYIERVGIKAPITWDIINNPADTAKALESGVIHIAGTAHPGEVGNVFITGHSSNYLWAPGDYKTVFAVLNETVIGDKIIIRYQGKYFSYKVSKSFVVKPTEISVMNQGQMSILTLVTCTPVGTSLNRLVVVANQTNPDPALNIRARNLQNSSKFPSAR